MAVTGQHNKLDIRIVSFIIKKMHRHDRVPQYLGFTDKSPLREEAGYRGFVQMNGFLQSFKDEFALRG